MLRAFGTFLIQALVGCHSIRTFKEEVEIGDLGLSDFPPLCDEEIVSQTCHHLNGDGRGLEIQKHHLANALSKTDLEMQLFWGDLDLVEGESVACKDLCTAVTEYIKDWHVLPPRSDIACYTIGRRWFCDVDVRPAALKSVGLPQEADIPDLHDDESAEAGQAMVGLAKYRQRKPDVTPWQLVERVANLFRIFPAEGVGKEDAFAPAGADAPSEYPEALRAIKKSGQLAEAFLGLVLRAFEHNKTGAQMHGWFGAADASVERNIRLTLNSAADLLCKAEFVFPGPQCQKKQIAYVLPEGRECSRIQLTDAQAHCATHAGKFVLYMCPSFLTHPAEQVLTLIHEASHHATAFTEDVCADPAKPPEDVSCTPKGYGRATCKLLAERMQARALINADSYCYYVQDVVDANLVSEWVPVKRSAAVRTASFTCPALAEPRGPFCRCLHGHHCFQGREEGCQLSSSTSLEYSKPDCADCQCLRCPTNARLLAGGMCECNEQFHCASGAGEGCHVDLHNFSLIDCPTCFCQRTPSTTKSKYKEHKLCTEPCGSMVQGQLLAENVCAQCLTPTDCWEHDCTLDVCADAKCGNFAYCKPWNGEPNCRCFSQYEETADGCHPVVEDDWRCCYTGLSHRLLQAMWVPRELQATTWYFKHICPTVHGEKWRKAPRKECTGAVFKHQDNYRLGFDVDV